MEAVPGEGELTPETRRGTAAELHALDPHGTSAEAWWLGVERPALVLGSTQTTAAIDVAACAAAGVDVVHRRSGGGAVLMIPDEILWLDVVLPRHDARWDDDVGRSMWWLGEAWSTALRALGVDDVEVHSVAPTHTRWSRLVCFDGLGAGEVTVGGRKAVGISQRRTRDRARLQSALHVAWSPELMVSLLGHPRPAPDDLADVWELPPDVDAAAVRAAVAAAL